MTSAASPAIWPAPVRSEVVVPGKFEVLARAPQSALKSVVLPVFGLPISATRRMTPSAAGGATAAGDSTAEDVAVMARRSAR